MLGLPELIRIVTPPQIWVSTTGYVLGTQVFTFIRTQWGLLTF